MRGGPQALVVLGGGGLTPTCTVWALSEAGWPADVEACSRAAAAAAQISACAARRSLVCLDTLDSACVKRQTDGQL